jgi:hypothetical protein
MCEDEESKRQLTHSPESNQFTLEPISPPLKNTQAKAPLLQIPQEEVGTACPSMAPQF